MRLLLTFLAILAFVILAIILWRENIRTYEVTFGVSFNAKYAESFGLDAQEVYTALLQDLRPPFVRVSALWDEIEAIQGEYDFTRTDFLIEEAERNGVLVTLTVGQKAPRWPECHVPDWATQLPEEEYRAKLLAYVRAVVQRYKDSRALEIWQVENEPFIPFEFGECDRYDKDIVSREITLVDSLDQRRPIMMTDSGELGLWYNTARETELFGTTVYRRVRTDSGRVWSYWWLPPVTYRLKSELWGRPVRGMFVSELQAEPWFHGRGPLDTPIAEQEETLSPAHMLGNIAYVKRIGVSRAYLWGAEWWYWMKETQNRPEYWDIAGQVFLESRELLEAESGK